MACGILRKINGANDISAFDYHTILNLFSIEMVHDIDNHSTSQGQQPTSIYKNHPYASE